MPEESARALRVIKLVHTVIWAFFVACIVAIPVLVQLGRFSAAGAAAAVVALEVMVIAFNRGRCPLTIVAQRHTSDRRDNFDIYLPVWLAKYNKLVFGSLYLAGLFYMFIKWLA